VLGTIEVLRLAVLGASKPVHYVSTSGVFYSRRYRGQALAESDAAEHCEGHALGYSQSKWVAERLVTEAGTRGLPITVHRAPFITGHSQTGAWNSDDFICRLVRGIVGLGWIPELSASMDIVPVDYVARAITQISQEPRAVGRRFHLAARNQAPWSALADWLTDHGYSVQRESYAAWLTRLPTLRGTDHPLAPFVALFIERAAPDQPTVPEVFLQSIHSRLDNTDTTAWLAGSHIETPEIDRVLWNTYLTALAARGLLPAPTASK
jgi:thioester reductase-like protein